MSSRGSRDKRRERRSDSMAHMPRVVESTPPIATPTQASRLPNGAQPQPQYPAYPAHPEREAPRCQACGALMWRATSPRWRVRPEQEAALVISQRWVSLGSEYTRQYGAQPATPLIWWCDHRQPTRQPLHP